MPAISSSPPEYRWLALMLAGVTLVFGTMSVATPVDDAFIIYRYAERWASGDGLTFNDGQHVEGATSLTWTVLLTLAARLGFPVASASTFLSLVTLVGTFVSLDWAMRGLRVRRGIRLGTLALFSLSTLQFKVTLFGLEFGLFALLLSLLTVYLGRLVDSGSQSDGATAALLAIVGGLLFLTRPETVVFLPGIYLVLMLHRVWRPSETAFSVKTANLALGGFFAIVLGATILRFSVFGQALPQSLAAKSPSWAALATRQGILQQLEWVRDGGRYFAAAYLRNPALAAILLLAIWLAFRGRRSLQLAVIGLPILFHHAVVIWAGGDWMPFDRFLSVFQVLFLLLFALVSEELLTHGLRPSLGLSGAVLGLVYVLANLTQAPPAWPPSLTRPVTGDHLYGLVGESLRARWREGDILLPEAIGRIGFVLPQATILDPESLVSPEIALQPDAFRSIYGRSHWPYALAQEPAVVLIHSLFDNRKGRTIVAAIENGYSAFCIRPLPKAIDGRWLVILMHPAREQDYLPAVASLLTSPLTGLDGLARGLDLQELCRGAT